MNIIFIITRSDAIGGAHIHVRDMAQRLLLEGNQVNVIVGGNGIYTKWLEDTNIPYTTAKHLVREINIFQEFLAYLELKKILTHLKPDLISTHSAKAGCLGRLAANSLKIPVIYTAHGWPFAEGVGNLSSKIYIFLEKKLSKLSSRIITVSLQDKNLAIHHHVADKDQQVVVHNGMPNIDLPKPQRTESHNIVITCIARIDQQKDHKTLLIALSKLKQKNWQLKLVGEGQLTQQLKATCSDLGIENKILFLGYRKDIAEILAATDIFVLISNWEGFPRSILEAMRASLPVIASNVGGVSESVIDGKTGYLVQRGDSTTLENKLLELMTSKKLREDFGHQGRERFLKYFTFDAMFEKTQNLYKEIISKPALNDDK